MADFFEIVDREFSDTKQRPPFMIALLGVVGIIFSTLVMVSLVLVIVKLSVLGVLWGVDY